jgi:hypothetical protein
MTTAVLIAIVAFNLLAVGSFISIYRDLFCETRETPASEPCSCQDCVQRAQENVWDAEADLITAQAELLALLGRAESVPATFSTPAAKGFNRDRRSTGELWLVTGPTRPQ